MAHWDEILRPFLLGVFVFLPSEIITVSGISVLMTLPMFALKLGWLRHNKGSWKLILIYSIPIALITLPVLIVGSGSWRTFLQSSYVANYSWVWFAIGVAATFLLLFSYITKFGNSKEFLNEFKAIPFASPVFCFGAPAFWTKSLSSFGLTAVEIKIAGAISFFCGVLFILGLILHYLSKHTQSSSMEESPIVVTARGTKLVEDHGSPPRIETAALAVTMVATGGFVFVVLKLAMGILVNMV
ncbi:hypothetical protein ACW73I_21490 [Methylomonas sp. MgM2]